MSNEPTNTSINEEERRQAVRRIIDRCIDDRLAGKSVSDHDLIEAHPDLLPDLADELRGLAVIERARERSRSGVGGTSAASASAGPADSVLTDPPDLSTGYHVIREIHRGGQGVVYEAIHQSTGRRVAIKVLLGGWSAGRKELARLQREVRILASLRHPHIVSVHESGEGADGSVYFVMDYIDGEPLDEFAARRWGGGRRNSAVFYTHKPVPPDPDARDDRTPRPQPIVVREKLQLFSQICAAVNEAHLRGVIHRDLKPGNILVDNNDQPQVLDFGLAKLMDDSSVGGAARAMTRTGQFVGSLPWASPEQAEGESYIDLRSDVYSLGVVLYQLLTGSLPYPVEGSTRRLLDHIVHTSAPPVSRMVPGVDTDVDTIVAKCLSKDRARRYQSAGEVHRDIELFLRGEPIIARRDSTWYVLRKSLKRHRLIVTAVLALFFIVLVSATALAFMYNNQREARLAESAMRSQAEAVTGYLQNMLSSADADVATRPDLTMREVLDRASARVDRDLSDQPLVEAAVRTTLGQAYQSLGRFDEAGRHLLAALAIRESEPDASPLNVASAQLHVGQWHNEAGRPEEAVKYYEQALATRRECLPARDPTIAHALTSYAAANLELAEFAESERMIRQAIDIYRAQPKTGRGLATALTHLGSICVDLGRFAEAERCLEEVAELRGEAEGVPDRFLAGIIHNLGVSRFQRGDVAEGKKLLEQALTLRREVLGPDHPDVAHSLSALSGVAYQKRQLDVARAHFEEAIAILRKTHADDHPDVLTMSYNLGLLLVESGESDAALALFQRQLPLERERLGEGHPKIADTLTQIARIKQRQGDAEAAGSIYEEVLEMRRAILDPVNPDIATTLSDLGSIAHDRKQLDKAEQLQREALAIRRKIYPVRSDHLAASVCMLSHVLLDQGRPEDAEPLVRECLEIRQHTRPGHWLHLSAMVRMGACLVDLGKDEDAEPWLREAYDKLQALDHVPAELRELARQELRELYEQTGRPEWARQLEDRD